MFLFYAAILVASVLLFLYFKRAGLAIAFSRTMLIATLFSILATVCLADNYIQSLIPGLQDGISISNSLAYYLIGEDNWSHATYQAAFEYAVLVSILCLISYIAASILEARK